MRNRLPWLVPCTVASLGCVTPPQDTPAAQGAEAVPEVRWTPDTPPPVVDTADGSDWVRLVSGEWLKGEVIVLDRKTLVFDSAELDELRIDWSDVAELRASRRFSVLLEGRAEATGTVHVVDEHFHVTDADGTRELARSDVFRMVPGDGDGARHWSGELGAGATTRSGNTDQLDVTTSLSVLRRTTRSRFTLDYDFAYGELEGVRNTDNQRLVTQVDRFLGARLFVTPFGLDLYRDRFQNLDLRAAVHAGLGYTLFDGEPVSWEVTAGPGYRYTRFDTVMPGDDDEEGGGVGILGTELSWDPVSRVEIDFEYSAQIGLRDLGDTNQSASLSLSVDLWSNLDLDVRMRWDRIGQPQPDSNGVLPEKDDYQLTVGLSWSF